ncbi:hypothetical protein J6590_103629 [Homalodisca vitripennis]|nr:hypothetical protein J6590_103629 [Homalodisca vitripennis]
MQRVGQHLQSRAPVSHSPTSCLALTQRCNKVNVPGFQVKIKYCSVLFSMQRVGQHLQSRAPVSHSPTSCLALTQRCNKVNVPGFQVKIQSNCSVLFSMQRVGQHLREQGTCQSLSHVLPCSNTEMQQVCRELVNTYRAGHLSVTLPRPALLYTRCNKVNVPGFQVKIQSNCSVLFSMQRVGQHLQSRAPVSHSPTSCLALTQRCNKVNVPGFQVKIQSNCSVLFSMRRVGQHLQSRAPVSHSPTSCLALTQRCNKVNVPGLVNVPGFLYHMRGNYPM